MTQLPMLLPERAFDGETYSPERDHERLKGLLAAVYACLGNGKWWTLQELQDAAGGTVASVSARIRDLRKPKYGAHRIERKYEGDGLWLYRKVE